MSEKPKSPYKRTFGRASETYGSMIPPETIQTELDEEKLPGEGEVPSAKGSKPVSLNPSSEGEQPQTAGFEAQEHAAAAEGEFGKMEPGAGEPTQRVESAPGVPGPAQPDVRESDEPPESRESTAPQGPLSTDDLTEREGKDAGEYPEETTGASHYPGEELEKPATDEQPNNPEEEKPNG